MDGTGRCGLHPAFSGLTRAAALRQYRAPCGWRSIALYFLASHVYLCVTDDHGVLLDLKRDKYVGVGRKQMQQLAACVKGWPVFGENDPTLALPRGRGEGTLSSPPLAGQETHSSPPPPAREGSEGANAFISKLLTCGILTTDPANGKEAQPVSMARPETTLTALDLAANSDPFEARPAITFIHVVNFLCASIAARLALRWRPIASVVSRARARKARSGAARDPNITIARSLVAAFVHLRPLLFTTKDACLADSLALILFLARYRLFPTWVFGVQTGPFAAHCWVQQGDVVFNDTPDHVRRYTPILTI